MPIRVPVNPETQPGGGQFESFTPRGQGYDVTGFAEGMNALGQSLQRRKGRQVAEQKQLDSFDLEHKTIVEINELNADFAERAKTTDAGALGFAERVGADYAARGQKIIEEATKAGYDKTAVAAMRVKLDSIYSGFYGKALGVQEASGKIDAQTAIGNLTDDLSQYVVAHPEGVGSAKEQLRQSINLRPELSEPEKQIEFERRWSEVALAGGQAFAQNNPKMVLEKLAPQFLPKKPAVVAAALSGSGRSINPWANVAIDVANEFGLNPKDLAAVMSFETGGTFDPNIEGTDKKTGKKYLGLIQFGPDERKTYGIGKNATPEQWTKAISQFFRDRKLPKGAGMEDIYSTILTGSPGDYKTKDSNNTNVTNAVPRMRNEHMGNVERWFGALKVPPTQTIAEPAPDNAGPPRPEIEGNLPLGIRSRVENADGSISTVRTISINTDQGEVLIPTVVDGKVLSDDEARAHYEKTHEHFGVFASPEQATRYGEWLHKQHEEELQGEKMTAKTGIAALDELNGAQRLQVINMARAATKENDTQARASIQLNAENAIAANQAGQPYVGPLQSKEEMQEVLGEVQGAKLYGQIEASAAAQPIISGMTTASTAGLTAQVEALKPTNTADPAFAAKQAVYEQVARAAQANLAQRDSDPMQYTVGAFPSLQQAFANAKDSNGRRAAYTQLVQSYRTLGIPEDKWLPVPQGEVAQLAQNYDALNPAQKMAQLDAWQGEMPPKLWVPFMVQMNGNDGRGPGYDIFMRSQFAGHPEYKSVMSSIFEGQSAIAQDPARKPSEAIINRAFAGQLTLQGLNPTASRIYNESAASSERPKVTGCRKCWV